MPRSSHVVPPCATGESKWRLLCRPKARGLSRVFVNNLFRAHGTNSLDVSLTWAQILSDDVSDAAQAARPVGGHHLRIVSLSDNPVLPYAGGRWNRAWGLHHARTRQIAEGFLFGIATNNPPTFRPVISFTLLAATAATAITTWRALKLALATAIKRT